MTDLIIFLVFIIAMTLFTGMIQAIQIEKYKEEIKSLKKDNKLLSELDGMKVWKEMKNYELY